MKLRKTRGILLTLGIGMVAIGAVLFFLIPFIAGKGFEYTGLDAVIAGAMGYLTLDFNNTLYTLLFSLTVASVLCLLWYLIIICLKKKGFHTFGMFTVLIVFLVIQVLLSAYFLVDVNFNGVDCKLFKAITELDGFMLPKILSILVLCCLYLGLMFLTLYVFIDISTMIFGQKVETVEFKTEKEEVVVEDEEFDDRKAREERLFAESIATGDYSEYIEIELEKPLEGYTEEPVFEATEIEEISANKIIKNKKNEQIIVVK